MRKNYFTKNLLAVMMMLAVSMSMTSCQGLVDAVFGSEDNPVEKPETTEKTKSSAEVKADGATITIASGDDLNDAVTEEQANQLLKAIEASAEADEEYTITIKSEEPLKAETFGPFIVPNVEDANINLVFDCEIESSEDSPLEIASNSESPTPTDKINEVTITLPKGSTNVYLSLDMPESTVTLDGNVTYQFVEAITATSTLVVESGVTIKELQTPIIFNRNSVVVKNGGVIETFVYRTDVYFMGITEKGLTYAVTPGLEFFFPIAKDENGDPYFINCLKVVKGDTEICGLYHTFSRLHNDGELSPDLKKLIIGDGAVVRNMNYTSIPYDDIIGVGNATFLYGYNMNEISSIDQDMKYVDMSDVNSLYNVTFKPKYDSGSTISNPNNAQNSLFEATSIYLNQALYQATNNVYNFTKSFKIFIPGQSSSISSANYTFDKCKFSDNEKLLVELEEEEPAYNADGTDKMVWSYKDDNGEYHEESDYSNIPDKYKDSAIETQATQPITFSNYKGTVEFNDCKYGSNDISKDLPFLRKGYFNDSNIDLKFVIDGTTYGYTYDPSTYDITLN